MRKKTKKNRIIALSMAILLSVTSNSIPSRVAAAEEKNYGLQNPRVTAEGTTWDKITFGNYYQTAEFEEEPIKWRILSVDEKNDDLFLLADQSLDCKPYNDTYTDVTWETCTLRSWLNGYGASKNKDGKDFSSDNFIDAAFTKEEQNAIKETTVVNEDTITDYYTTEGGNDTKDKVYCLSISEATNASYGFDKEYEEETKTREAKNTFYAELQGAYTYTYDDTASNGEWWLRSPGSDNDRVAEIDNHGQGYSGGSSVDAWDIAVRPALHISLSSATLTPAGTVDSDGKYTSTDTNYQNPRVDKNNDGKIAKITWDCVYFGKYKQEVTSAKEPIEWRVLSVNGDDAFLLAEQSLDKKAYNETESDVIWEKSTIRSWLNGYGVASNEAGKDFSADNFLDTAFSVKEKDAVKEQTIETEDDASYQTLGGSKTHDKIYLLSIAEVTNAMYGFDDIFTCDSTTRQAKNSAYAIMQGANNYGNGSWWMLRSAYAGIRYTGHGYAGPQSNAMPRVYGFYMNDFDAVRPALHLSLSSSLWKYAGTVSHITVWSYFIQFL